MSKTKTIVNLYGGPGAGKSTVAAQLYAEMKIRGFASEMVREFIKGWVWEGRKTQPGDQLFFYANQCREERILMLAGVDCVITDSPLGLCNFFGQKYDPVEKEFNSTLPLLKDHLQMCQNMGYRVVNVFLIRKSEYDPQGRYEDEKTAKQYDREIREHLKEIGMPFVEVDADTSAAVRIAELVSTEKQQKA